MSDFITLIPNWLPGWLGAGAAAGGSFGVIKWVLEFVAGRIDKRTAALDADTRFVIDNLKSEVTRLSQRVDAVEEDLVECTRKHAAAEARALHLEAILQGLGDARQTAALIVASEKAKGN